MLFELPAKADIGMTLEIRHRLELAWRPLLCPLLKLKRTSYAHFELFRFCPEADLQPRKSEPVSQLGAVGYFRVLRAVRLRRVTNEHP